MCFFKASLLWALAFPFALVLRGEDELEVARPRELLVVIDGVKSGIIARTSGTIHPDEINP